MSFAVQSIAKQYPNIDLIYRDFTNKNNNEFSIINYREFPPYAGTIKGEITDKQINIDFLYNKEQYNNNFKNFLEKLLK